MRTFQPACVTKVSKGMVVNTETEKVRAPARKHASSFDKSWKDGSMPYAPLLKSKPWNLESEPEELAVLVDGKPVKCAVAHNLGQVKKLLEGDYSKYDIVRLLA